jgi:hypothetical protein
MDSAAISDENVDGWIRSVTMGDGKQGGFYGIVLTKQL